MKLLTICIPTYNRSDHVIAHLELFLKELSSYQTLVDIKVADDFSEQKHKDRLARYHDENGFFSLEFNSENLGLIGNINSLCLKSESQYVWFLGDDDVVKPGALSEIVEILISTEVDFLFLNYDVFYEIPERSFSTNQMLGFKGQLTEDRNFVVEFFKKNGTACMFMSSGIHKVDWIRALINTDREPSITDPLLFFFKSGQGSVYVEERVLVLDRLSGILWRDQQRSVFAWKVPNTLLEARDILGYSEESVAEMMYSYFKTHRNFVIMLAMAPLTVKRKILFLSRGRRTELIFDSICFLSSVLIGKLRLTKRQSVLMMFLSAMY